MSGKLAVDMRGSPCVSLYETEMHTWELILLEFVLIETYKVTTESFFNERDRLVQVRNNCSNLAV